MEQTHGTWGNRLKTFEWDGGLVTLLFLEPHQQCSYHFHKTTYNQFTVISGVLGVETEKGFTTRLAPKQTFTVEPGVKHKFITYDLKTVVEEVAYTKYLPEDIYRTVLGGSTKG